MDACLAAWLLLAGGWLRGAARACLLHAGAAGEAAPHRLPEIHEGFEILKWKSVREDFCVFSLFLCPSLLIMGSVLPSLSVQEKALLFVGRLSRFPVLP